MNKRGQIQLSFGVIFSIIIIVVTLAVAGYIISQFVDITKEASCKIYYSDLQEYIDKAWSAQGSTQSVYSETLPSGSESICFGNVTLQALTREDLTKQENIEKYAKKESNMFFYPRSVCNDDDFSYKLNHIQTQNFFCINVNNGKANIKINKGTFDSLVKIGK